jgi:hypothetical protein
LNGDICQTHLADDKIDLTLMIDVLEHLPDPSAALRELRRISKFVIFKVPLEDSLSSRVFNLVRGGKPRQHAIKVRGHIHVYHFASLRQQIEQHTGNILACSFTNVSEYYCNSEHHRPTIPATRRLLHYVAAITFRISPKLSTLLFDDYVVMLVRTYDGRGDAPVSRNRPHAR